MRGAELVQRLHADGLTLNQIIETAGMTRPEVLAAYVALGISKKKFHRPASLTEWEDAILLGTMLGDGCIRRKRAHDLPYFSLSHAEKQRDYLVWKAGQLSTLFINPEPRGVQVDGDGHRSVHLTSRTLPLLEPYEAAFYSRGKKAITEDMLSRIEAHAFFPAILAVWFGDDGYRSSGNGKSVGFTFGALNDETYERLALWFTEHGFEGKLHSHMGRTSYKYYLLRVVAAHRFRDFISPYLPDCMQYKLDIGPPRNIRRSREQEV